MGAGSVTCALCGREVPMEFAEKHHLTPRSHGGTDTVDVCCNCGDQIHRLFSNDELAKRLHTVEALLAEPSMQRWVQWAARQRSFSFSMRRKKGRKNERY